MTRSTPTMPKSKSKTLTQRCGKSFVKAVLQYADNEIKAHQLKYKDKKEALARARATFRAYHGSKSKTSQLWDKVDAARQEAVEAGSDLWALYIKYFHTGVIEMENGEVVHFVDGNTVCCCKYQKETGTFVDTCC